MKATDYVITPVDVYTGIRRLTIRHYVGLFAAVAVWAGLTILAGSDLAILVAGLVFMFTTGASYRLPLVGAIGGLLLLMVLSPFAHDGNSIDGLSENLAVFVFFMLIFGVAKMVYDEASAAVTGKDKAKAPTQRSHARPATPQQRRAQAPTPRPQVRTAQPRPTLRPARQNPRPVTRMRPAQTKVSTGNYLDLSAAQPVKARTATKLAQPVQSTPPTQTRPVRRRNKQPPGLIQG